MPNLQILNQIADSFQNILGTIGEIVDILSGGNTAEHQYRIDIGFNTRNDIRVHPVANEGNLTAVTAQTAQTASE